MAEITEPMRRSLSPLPYSFDVSMKSIAVSNTASTVDTARASSTL